MEFSSTYRHRHWAYKQETNKVLDWLKKQTSTEHASINYYVQLARKIKGRVPSEILESLQKAIDGRLEAAEDHAGKGNADEKHAHFINVLDEILQIFGHESRLIYRSQPKTPTTPIPSFDSDSDADADYNPSPSLNSYRVAAMASIPPSHVPQQYFFTPAAPEPSLTGYILSQESPSYTYEGAWDPAWNCNVGSIFPSVL